MFQSRNRCNLVPEGFYSLKKKKKDFLDTSKEKQQDREGLLLN